MNWKRRYFLIAILTLYVSKGFSQTQAEPNNDPIKHTAFVELGGSGLLYSLNYERIFQKEGQKTKIARVGFSYFGDFDTSSTVTVPVTFSFLFCESPNFLELGAGPTILHSFEGDITGIAALAVIGYRHQHLNRGGIFYRFTLTPFIGEYSSDKDNWRWIPLFWGGASIGWGF